MFVTPSLAHGAVREAVRLTSEKVDAMWKALERAGIDAPSTYRRFDDWFRKYRGIYEQAALLIVFGKIGRRRGAFSAFTPAFEEVAGGWDLEIRQVSLKFSPDYMEQIDVESLPVTISGHALERIFQRNASIEWRVVRECLASAALLLPTAIPVYVAAGCKQCAIPAEKGLLVGQVVGHELMLKTFLPEQQLQPKWQTLLSDLNTFIAEHKVAIETNTLTPDDEPGIALKALLAMRKHKWLLKPYVSGVDPLEDAWRSIETSADAHGSRRPPCPQLFR